MRHLLDALAGKGPDVSRPAVRMVRIAALFYCPSCDAVYEGGGPSATVVCPACGSTNVLAARVVPVAA